MWQVTLATLTRDVLLKADMVGSPFPLPGEVTRYVNQGITELHELLMASGQDYRLRSATITTSNNVDTYALPFAFMGVKGIDINIGGQQQFDGTRANWAERNRYKLVGNGWYYGNPVYYDLREQNLWVMPQPQGSYSVTLWYYPVPDVLASQTDSTDCVSGWEELITTSAAIKLLAREESWEAVDRLKADYALTKARIQSAAPKRNYGEPPRVTESSRTMKYSRWRRSIA